MIEMEYELINFFKNIDRDNLLTSIALQGGYARTNGKEFSDLDVVLVFKEKPEKNLYPKGFSNFLGMKLDIRHLYLNNLCLGNWDDKVKFVYKHETKVIYDKENLLNKLIEEIYMTEQEQLNRIIYIIKKLGNRGITYKGLFNCYWKGFYWDDPVDYWIKKGDIFSAHNRLNECVILIYKLLFAINKEYVPSAKWLYNTILKLPWLPTDINNKLDKIVSFKLDEDSFYDRVKGIIEILNDCVDYMEDINLLSGDLKLKYVNSQGMNYYTDNL